MKVLVKTLLLIVIFASGLLWGLMYDTALPVSNDEGFDYVDLSERQEGEEAWLEPIPLKEKPRHPIERFAKFFERTTLYLFELVVSILYGLANLVFS